MSCLFAFVRPWGEGGDVATVGTESTAAPASRLKNWFRHQTASETTGAVSKGWSFDFDDTSVDVAAVVLFDPSYKKTSTDDTRLQLQLSQADPFGAVSYDSGEFVLRSDLLYPGKLLSPNPIGQHVWCVHTDEQLSGSTSGTPAVAAAKTGKILFENATGPGSSWDASMLMVFVDPVLISEASPDRGATRERISVLRGVGSELKVTWSTLSVADSLKLQAAYERSQNEPFLIMPSIGTINQRKQSLDGGFAAGSQVALRGGAYRWSKPPVESNRKDADGKVTMTASFIDIGATP